MENLRLDRNYSIVYTCGGFVALVSPFALFKRPLGRHTGIFSSAREEDKALNDGQAAKFEVKKEPKGQPAGTQAGLQPIFRCSGENRGAFLEKLTSVSMMRCSCGLRAD
jgi:hypothetical protein